mgnify:CR=1 FL=1
MQYLLPRKKNMNKIKFLEIAYLTKIEKANLNASGTEGNVTILKKTEEIDGTQKVFVSGASIKYAIKEYWKSIGWKLSPIKEKSSTTAEEIGRQITTECNLEKYIDDDLLGFMDTSGGKTKKRVAPVKTNGLISVFPYKGDMNRGVRFDPTGKEQHSLYDIEITTNVMRGNFAIELDRIGYDDEKGKMIIKEDEKKKRIEALFGAIFNLWGGGHQTNFLTKLSPEFMVIIGRNDKSLTVADKLRVDENYNLDVNALKEVLDLYRDKIGKVWIGGLKGFVKNWPEIEKLKDEEIEVMELSELKENLLKAI